ncbi:hypothetical protein QJ054_34015 [Streptomyces sp. AN-3]|uniref:hypothetical protein n=1 Tax=Streptomyces sp. AN-3 TaxID=3044177 RepID=UPI00249CCDC1|nr:hypothetical protein [Streptomyces sp. AN-3]MDI3102055.1 hypothetical protein [Streptomyces sp. AN-3]MDV6291301.1 hypothetical protein [Streptomyces sp. UP1A-1]
MDKPIAPYVTPWTGESTAAAPVAVTASGVAYADPVQDAIARDLDGTLWALCEGTAIGKPQYGAELHPERQRAAMEALLCACCTQPASRNEHGMLWVLPILDESVDTRWEGVRSAIPPMCEACALSAPPLCPWLRDGHVQLRVREAELIGVLGTLYPRPGSQEPLDPAAFVPHDSPNMPFVVARQAVRELRSITVVTFAADFP